MRSRRIIKKVGLVTLLIFGVGCAAVIQLTPWQKLLQKKEPVIDGIQCAAMEGTALHIHSHLDIFVDGKQEVIPTGIGIAGQGQGECYYWLHTHDATGIIHVESPIKRTFTLGEFFDIWKQPLTSTQVGKYSDGKQIRIFIDGKPYNGDLRSIQLKSHENIVLEVGPTFVSPPAPYKFPAGL